MATIKINYGSTYSMVKTSSKITSPSVAVDGGWIPCFKGDRFAEVKSGDRIYTLSPIMVNGYRMACGSRIAFNGTIYVHVPYSVSILGGNGSSVTWQCNLLRIKTASTNVTGYSCSLSIIKWTTDSRNVASNQSSVYPYNAAVSSQLIANYTVSDSSHNTVKTGTINKLITIDPYGKTSGAYEEKIAV